MKILRNLFYVMALAVATVFSSCSSTDYLNAIPAESSAVISMDMAKLSGVQSPTVLKAMLHVSNLDNTGLDLSSKLYLFETQDGEMGLCAKVDDEDDVEKLFNGLAQKGICPQVRKRRGLKFTMVAQSWVVGWSSKALLIMGPAPVTEQAELQNQMTNYLHEDEDEGFKSSPLYDKLDSIGSPISMVAQAKALPDKLIAPFTLGAPKNTDPSQVLIAASMKPQKGVLYVNGSTFSLNSRIDAALKKAAGIYRPISGKYSSSMPKNALLGVFMNVKGTQFVPLMHNNPGLVALLAGISRAIDMDNILKSVDGELSIVSTAYSDENLKISMAAQLGNKQWLNDVGYWKQSCPEGGRILDWGKDAYYYTDSKTTFYFGASNDMQFYSGSSAAEALSSIKPSTNPISADIQRAIKGQKMVMMINPGALVGGKSQAVATMLNPLFGNVNTILFTLNNHD